jgi:WD40 repeat protein
MDTEKWLLNLIIVLAILAGGCTSQKAPAQPPTQAIAAATHAPPPVADTPTSPPPTSTPTTVPTNTPKPTNTPAPTNTPTPTLTPTPVLPVEVGTPLPFQPLALTAANVKDLRLLTHWGKGIARRAVFSPDGSQVAVAYNSGIGIYAAKELKEIRWMQPQSMIYTLEYSPDGKRLAGGGEQNLIFIWDAADGKELLTLKGHQDAISTLAFSPDGSTLVSGSDDKTVKLWNAADGKLLHTINVEDYVDDVVVSPDNTLLASAADDGAIKLWNMSDGSLAKKLFKG